MQHTLQEVHDKLANIIISKKKYDFSDIERIKEEYQKAQEYKSNLPDHIDIMIMTNNLEYQQQQLDFINNKIVSSQKSDIIIIDDDEIIII
jgi:hypothetical protein